MSADVATYRKLRAQGWRPADATRQARNPAPLVEAVDPEAITLTVDGWTVKITAEQDPDHEHELGTFDNSWAEGALDLGSRIQRNASGFRYFHPATSYTAHRAGLRKVGYSRHAADCLARQYVREDMQIELGLTYTPWIISVVASSSDVDFGFDARGGVTLGRDGITVEEVVDYAFQTGMVGNAVQMAQEKLDEVIRQRGHLRLVASNAD